MVTDRFTDPERIFELFAAEIEGCERGILGAVQLADDGRILERDGERVGRLDRRDGSLLLIVDDQPDLEYRPERADISVRIEEAVTIEIASGAAVKPAIDMLETMAR